MIFSEPTLEKVLQLAIEVENAGANFYADLAERFTSQTKLAELFTVLGEEEISHAEKIKDLEQIFPNRVLSEEEREYLEAIALAEFYAINDGPFEGIAHITRANKALEFVYDFEKTALAFYEGLENILGEHPLLSELISMEKKHVIAVAQAIIRGGRFKGLGD